MPHGVAIGTRLAELLGLTIGGNLTLVSPRGNVTPLGVTPRIKSYPVVAIFEIGMSEYDFDLRLPAVRRGADLFQSRRRGERHRGLSRQCRQRSPRSARRSRRQPSGRS